ncbi:MAG: hypothetical protein U1F14_08640 [Steroidobacteraceae bacterium]
MRIKSVEQQALQSLHRVRSAWMATRTARINTARLLPRVRSVHFGGQSGRHRADRPRAGRSGIRDPQLLREPMKQLLEEIRLLEARHACAFAGD